MGNPFDKVTPAATAVAEAPVTPVVETPVVVAPEATTLAAEVPVKAPEGDGTLLGEEPKSADEIAKLAAEADAKAKAEADAKAEALKNETPATMTNVNLYLAIEQNPVIVEEVKNKVLSSGLSFTYPYPIILKQGLGATQNASATFKFTKSYGQRLLRVITAESLTSNSNVTRCCFYNWANPLPYITGTYRTTLNSTQLQDETIDESKGDGYRYNAQKLKGCPLENLVEYYTQCPCNIDDWSAADKMIDAPEADLQMCGISLENEQIYGKIITKNPYNANTYYDTTMTAIGVVQRTLTLGPYGVTVRT